MSLPVGARLEYKLNTERERTKHVFGSPAAIKFLGLASFKHLGLCGSLRG